MTELDEVYAALDPALGASDAVYEGYLLHYEAGGRLETDDDDLKLLAGDAFYALGMARLAASGDLPEVARLADLITACAKAHAEGNPEAARVLWKSGPR